MDSRRRDGDLPGGGFYSEGRDISADGSVIVGQCYSSSGKEAFRWTRETGIVGLGSLPGSYFNSMALAVSDKGNVVAGLGFIKTPGTGIGHEAFRWTVETGMVGLGDLPGDDFISDARDILGDGIVIVGSSVGEYGAEAFRWTAMDGIIGLENAHENYDSTAATAASQDGSVIVGWCECRFGEYWGRQPFRWTKEDGMVPLGFMTSSHDDIAAATSGDGSVIVGWGVYGTAFIWDQYNGGRDLKTVLQNNYGLDLTGWILLEAHGISADGLTIVGSGVNPYGNTEGWIATIPEPTTIMLLGFGALMMRKRRDR